MVLVALALVGTLSSVIAQEHSESAAIVFDIPAQPMAGALQAFAKQADLQILFKADSVGEIRAPNLSGRLTVQQALDVLLRGTGLEHVRDGDVVVVRIAGDRTGASAVSEGPHTESSGLAIAQVGVTDAAAAGHDTAADVSEEPAAQKNDTMFIGETLVTGTLIRGATPASPVILIGRDAIDASGYSTVQQLIQSLPQNYGGGDNESTVLSPGGSALNVAMGSSVNLRGLGSDATLTLLNGRRLAPSAYGQFVDLSMIPLSAIERVEVLTDGASATYGSDAVGGVVNIILRDDYEGAETLLRGGAVTDGHLEEYQISQTLGGDWDRGHVLFTYEYFKRGNLDASERDYAANAAQPFDLIAQQESNSGVLTGAIDLSERVELYGTAIFTEREALWRALNLFSGEPNAAPSTTRQLTASVGTIVDLSGTWQADVAALYSENSTDRDIVSPTLVLPADRNQLDLKSIEATFDGRLFGTPGGEAKLALGASYREERYVEERFGNGNGKRDVSSMFAEFQIPLMQHVDFTVAGRYEEYSDFGGTFNPKLGLTWAPVSGFRVRGTYGTSFRAPVLFELDDYNLASVLIDLADPASTDGTTLTMIVTGNNPALEPEEATTWTAGFDIEPSALPDANLSLTYFDTEFKDRIVGPLPSFEVLGVYSQADVYAPIINRDPDPARVSELAAIPDFFNVYGPFVPEDVEAIVDRRLQNISATQVRGLDLSASYAVEQTTSRWLFQVAATYVLDYTDAITETAPEVEVLDTAFHQVDLRARASASWQRGGWTIAGFINYTDGFTNETVTPPASVDAWTTIDLQVGFETQESDSWIDNTRLALSALNLLDEEPPFMTTPVAQFDIGFDPTNASPLGRFLSLTLTKRW